jgi:hypothetical protein
MNASLTRVILYVQDVERLAHFYRDALELDRVEEIKGEWATYFNWRTGSPMRMPDRWLEAIRASPRSRRPSKWTASRNRARRRNRIAP